MTPTPTAVLLVALFWTLPAGAAVLTYRKHGRSTANVTAALKLFLKDAFDAVGLQPQPEM